MSWWLRIGANLGRESVRVRLPCGLTRHLPGNTMPAKKTAPKKKRQPSKTSPPPADASSTLSTVTQNLINMVVVSAVSGAVLLGLIAARHF
jgi:hypothetical protein